MTSSITPSIESAVVSIATASPARTSGAAARVRSLRSRASRAVATSAIAAPVRPGGVERIVRAAAGALLGRGVEEHLDVRIRKHHRPDVAPLHHDRRPCAHRALLRARACARTAGLPRDRRRRRRRSPACESPPPTSSPSTRDDAVADLDPGARAPARRRPPRRRARRPSLQRLPRHGAVHRAGVDVPVTEARGDASRNGAFARARGSVDRNDQPCPHRGLFRTSAAAYYPRDAPDADSDTDLRRGRAACWRSGPWRGSTRRGAAFVARAAGAEGLVRDVAEWGRRPVTETVDRRSPWRGGHAARPPLQPATGATGRPLLLVPGVHAVWHRRAAAGRLRARAGRDRPSRRSPRS